MRLWHYELVRNGLLPNSQLISQWRELNCIFRAGKDRINHVLINYVKESSDYDLLMYTYMVMNEMFRRKIRFVSFKAFKEYFGMENFSDERWQKEEQIIKHVHELTEPVFREYHTNRYLIQCYWNLAEKYDRGQKDFDTKRYEKLKAFMERKGLL